MATGVLVLGNQLFTSSLILDNLKGRKALQVFMREDLELCTYYKFHKHKIVFFLAAMRAYADELRNEGFEVHYERLGAGSGREKQKSYEQQLVSFLANNKIKLVCHFEIEDKFFEKRIKSCLDQAGIAQEIWPSPMFLTSRKEFRAYLDKTKRPYMKTFYEGQRKRLRVLVDKELNPIGGQWSFDEQNRLPLPKGMKTPALDRASVTNLAKEVIVVCDANFATHPGKAEEFWLPVDRSGARKWLGKFLKERLENFGPFEDAIPENTEFLFHSILTPYLNCGLLTPDEVIEQTLSFAKKNDVPMNSLEGFVRQVIGWREFVRGIYQNYSEKQDVTNFWKHSKKLAPVWYTAQTGIPPLDDVIRKTLRFGFAHHIERLMIVGSLMLLLEVDPAHAHRWYMEMFIDSSDWVMGPNVYGMALFSDGGIFATKPYICGSNYYRKMGGYKRGDWCEGVDGLYWGFIDKHRDYFLRNPRLSMSVRTFDKLAPERKRALAQAALDLKKRLTVN